MTPEFIAYQVQVLKNCSKFAQVRGYESFPDSYFCNIVSFSLRELHFFPPSVSGSSCFLLCRIVLIVLWPLSMQSLVDLGYDLVSGGTDNHLVLVNLRNKVQ